MRASNGDFIGKTYLRQIAVTIVGAAQNGFMARTPDSPIVDRMKEAARLANFPPTQSGIAKMLGIKQPSVAEWNQGKMPTIDRVVLAAQRTKLCVEWIYTGRGPKFVLPTQKDDALLNELLVVWEKLSLETRTNLVQTAKLMRTVQITATPERVREVHRELERANHEFRERHRK